MHPLAAPAVVGAHALQRLGRQAVIAHVLQVPGQPLLPQVPVALAPPDLHVQHLHLRAAAFLHHARQPVVIGVVVRDDQAVHVRPVQPQRRQPRLQRRAGLGRVERAVDHGDRAPRRAVQQHRHVLHRVRNRHLKGVQGAQHGREQRRVGHAASVSPRSRAARHRAGNTAAGEAGVASPAAPLGVRAACSCTPRRAPRRSPASPCRP